MKTWPLHFSAWVISLVATLGSLFLSEVMGLPPCSLCWYQRICMYPLVLILAVPVLSDKEKENVFTFSFPLTILGWVISLYHNLLYYKILPESAAPCRQGISCTSFHFEWMGFVTIPLLSFTAFTLISLLLLLTRKVPHET